MIFVEYMIVGKAQTDKVINIYFKAIVFPKGCPSVCRDFTNFVLEFILKMSEFTPYRRASLILFFIIIYNFR
jgi:hypothetical protein